MRHYEIMIILDPNLEERTVQPSLEGFLKVVTTDGGKVGKLDIWGKRRLSYPIDKKPEGIYAVVDLTANPSISSARPGAPIWRQETPPSRSSATSSPTRNSDSARPASRGLPSGLPRR